MDRETFVDILYSKSMRLSSEEIEAIMDEELAKPPEEMNTDLVDICLDALDGKFDDIQETADENEVEAENEAKTENEADEDDCIAKSKNKKKVKIGRALLIAAIVALILGISITVGAKYLNIDASDDVVQYSDDSFNVNLKNNSIDNITSVLEQDGLSNIVLPTEITDGTYEISNYNINKKDDGNIVYDFDINSNKYGFGHMTIQVFNDNFDFSIGERQISSEFENVKQINKENYTIVVFGDNEDSYLYYVIDNIEYSINFNMEFSIAYDIAKGM